MNVKELYQSCFHDNDAFSDLFLSGRGAIPIVIEEMGEPIALATISVRALAPLNPSPKGQRIFAYDKNAKVALVGGFCVRADCRGKGYARKLMTRVLAACTDLRCLAVYLSPDLGLAPMYEKFGFSTVLYTRTAKIAQKRIQAKLPYEITLDLYDPSCDATTKRLYATRVARIMNMASFAHIGLRYDIEEAMRLMTEGASCEGAYLVQANKHDCAFCIRDGQTLPVAAVLRALDPSLVLGLARENSKLPNFKDCNIEIACSSQTEDAHPNMMIKYLRREDYNKFLRLGTGMKDIPLNHMYFERY